ncbi:hypothetical protein [Sphingobium ummariense]
MTDPDQPSPRRAGRAAAWVIGILLALILVLFVARNVWHGEELKEDQATGANTADHYRDRSNY